jgi:outer membrane murein-binding lipoprotein Lpp
MFRRRRPVLGAAMLGGAVMAGRHSQQAQYREQDQEARIEDLESQQQPAAAAPAAAPSAAAQSPLVDQIKQLADLKESGVLTPEEFDAAKQKLLAS